MKVEFELVGITGVNKRATSLRSLVHRFDPDEFGVSCPSASVRGVAGSKLVTEISLKQALVAAFTNHGLDINQFWVDLTPLDEEPVEISNPGRETYFKFLNWRVKIRPRLG
jgi:hypothetical protein